MYLNSIDNFPSSSVDSQPISTNNSVLMVWPGNPSTLLVYPNASRQTRSLLLAHRVVHRYRRCHPDILVPGEEVPSALGRFPEILQGVLRITIIGEQTPLLHGRSSCSWAALASSRFAQSLVAAAGEARPAKTGCHMHLISSCSMVLPVSAVDSALDYAYIRLS